MPIDGQPASIVQDLDDMARQYIKGDNAIILAVTPANADLATSDALRMAREVCMHAAAEGGDAHACSAHARMVHGHHGMRFWLTE